MMDNTIKRDRYDNLRRVCKYIIGHSYEVDDHIKNAFKTAALGYAHSLGGDPVPVLKRLYNGGELGDLVRKAFEVIDEAGEVEVSKARQRHPVSAHGLAAAVVEHFQDLLHHRRRHLGLAKADNTGKDSTTMTQGEYATSVAKEYGCTALATHMTKRGEAFGLSEAEFVKLITAEAQAEHPSLSKEMAFEKFYMEPGERGLALRKACQVAKAAEVAGDPMMKRGRCRRPRRRQF